MSHTAVIRDFGRELRQGGAPVLAGAFLGSSMGVSSIPFYTLGVFAGPLQVEFGWSRAATQASLAFSMLGMILAAVPIGWLTDRFGVRKTASIGLLFMSASLVALAMAGPSLIGWFALWTAMALFSSGTTAVTWTRGIADWFEKSRGFALGLTLMGNGFTAVIAPPIVTSIIATHGWRAAYIVLAIAAFVIGFIPTVLLFRAKPGRIAKTHEDLPGLTIAGALRGYRLYLMSIAFICLSFGIAGLIPNLVPLMKDRNFSAMEAASYVSLIGISVIVGRAGTGYLLDRFWAPGVAAVLLLLPISGCLLLSMPNAGRPVVAYAVLAIGFTAGMEFDIMGYFCARYFGFRNYGKIFAGPWIGFAIGAATGAATFGWMRDVTNSYGSVLLLATATFAVAALMFLGLGRYPVLLTSAIPDTAP